MKKIFITFLTLAVSVSAFAKKSESASETKEPFKRGIGIPTSVFIPKGTVGFGASFSYSTYDVGNSTNDYGFQALFGMINGIQGNIVTGGVSPHASYFVADNLAVGARFDYKRSSYAIGSANLSLTSDMSFGIENFHYLKDNYAGAIFARYYIPFGNSKRFAMFTELQAAGGYAQSETYKLTEADQTIAKHGTYQDIYNFEIGVIPGVMAFFTDNVALEVSVGLIGLNYNKIVQNTNQVGTSVMESSGANFKVNLLNINLGIAVYIPTGTPKVKKSK